MENHKLNQPSPETPVPPQTPKKNQLLIVSGIIVTLALIALSAFSVTPKSNPETLNQTAENSYKPVAAAASKFASYQEVPVNVSPKIPAYTVSPNLSNITNAKDFTFSEPAKKLLVKNAFVVIPAYNDEFFPFYETNRYDLTPNFITTDSLVHNYHLMFDFLLRQVEERKLAAELKRLNAAMLAESLNQYKNWQNTEWENAAKRNVGF